MRAEPTNYIKYFCVISHLFIYQVSLIPKFVLIGMVCSSSKKILHFVIFLDRTFPESQINI